MISENQRGEYTVCDHEYAVDTERKKKLACEQSKKRRKGEPDFYYLDSEYGEWAIEYVCIDVVPGHFSVDSISIKARKPKLNQSTIELISSVI